MLNVAVVRIIRCYMEMSMYIVDLAGAQARLQRSVHLHEVWASSTPWTMAGCLGACAVAGLVDEQVCCVVWPAAGCAS